MNMALTLVLGEQNGPVWVESGSFEAYMSQHLKQLNRASVDVSEDLNKAAGSAPNTTAASSYWLPKLARLGVVSAFFPLSCSAELI